MPKGTVRGTACARCGHTRRATGIIRLTHAVRRGVGLKSVRMTCNEPTDNGWACPCRSRFHAG